MCCYPFEFMAQWEADGFDLRVLQPGTTAEGDTERLGKP